LRYSTEGKAIMQERILVSGTTGNDMLKHLAELMTCFHEVGNPGDPAEVNRILGAPATTLADWVEQRKEQAVGAAAEAQRA
jgi:hypothetical protein